MNRTVAYIVVLLLALAGCRGPTGEEGGSIPPTFSTSPTSTADPSVIPTEPGATSVPPESGSSTGGGNGGGNNGGNNGEDEQAIEVGGPTLDNTFPTNPFALPREGASSCVVFTNRLSDVPVTVRWVRLVGQQPADDPGLALGDNPAQAPQCLPGHPSYPEGLEQVYEDCTGATLQPGQRTGCPVEVRSVGSVGTDYTAVLVLGLSATCTSKVGDPCARLEGRASPTPADPVTVTWSHARNYCSCLVPRQRDGEFLPEEGDGRCPPKVEPSESSSSVTEPVPEEESTSEESPGSAPSGPSDQSQPSAEGGEAGDAQASADSSADASASGGESTP